MIYFLGGGKKNVNIFELRKACEFHDHFMNRQKEKDAREANFCKHLQI